MNSLNILSLDPAARTGWAWSDGIRRHSGTFTLGPKRESDLRREVLALLAKYPTDVLAFESAGFGSHNPAVKAKHDELAGVLKTIAQDEGLKCWPFNPMTWKKLALGKGNLDKAGVMRALKTLHGITETDNDIADSIGILLAAQQGPPPLTKKKQAKRIQKVLKAKQPMLFRVK